MGEIELSILIPARNEVFLKRTVENILKNIRGNTEIIVVMDGGWVEPALEDNERLTIIQHNKSVGQRQATNEACKLSKARWIMKIDAHCAVDEGFDVKMMKEIEGHDDWTMLPTMFNLHAFNWRCKKCGNEWYQSPTPSNCRNPGENKGRNNKCDSTEFEKKIYFEPRKSRRSECYRFDTTLHFQYWGALKKKQKGDIVETLSAQGSCFMLTRKKYWELNISDEAFGSWGQQGTEVACKTWLSGGRLVTNRKTWYAHMFRTQGGDFGFPYKQDQSQINGARKLSRDLFFYNRWEGQTKPLAWLLDKFKPVPGWHTMTKRDDPKKASKVLDLVMKEGAMYGTNKGIIFYTDNQLNLKIAHRVQKTLRDIGLPIASASLKPMKNMGINVHLKLKRGWITMNKQIIGALEASRAKYVFFCEHDVVYHQSHFDFTPPKDDVFYYNTNVWKVRAEDGHSIRTDDCRQLSGLVCNREFAIKHFKKRLQMLEDFQMDLDLRFFAEDHNDRVELDKDFNRYVRKIGFEPGTHSRSERVDDFGSEAFNSKLPNVDIRHGANSTATRWSPDKFRNKKYTKGWTEANEIPGWGKVVFDLK